MKTLAAARNIAKNLGIAIFGYIVLAQLAFADPKQGIAGMQSNTKTQGTAIYEAILLLAFVMGALFAVMGLVRWYKAGKEGGGGRDEASSGLKMLGAGVLLCMVPTIITLGAGTATGDGQTATQEQRQLINK